MTLKFGFKREEEHLSDSNICAGFHCQGVQRARICGGPEGQNTIHHNTTLIKLRQFYKTQQHFTKQDNTSYYGTGETVCFVTGQKSLSFDPQGHHTNTLHRHKVRCCMNRNRSIKHRL